MGESLPIVYVIIFAALLLGAYITGGMFTSRTYHEVSKDRADLREDRKLLMAENQALKEDLLEVRRKLADLEVKYVAAMQHIRELSATLDKS
jgi:hypothetical protein